LVKIIQFRIPREELIRKSIHLSAILVPISYYFIKKTWILTLIGFGLVIALAVEFLRRKNITCQKVFNQKLGSLLRKPEFLQLTGATYLIIGCLLCVAVMPKKIAIFGLAVVIVADAMAALVGRSIGGHRLFRAKTWEGTAAFFLSTWLLGLAILNINLGLLFVVSGIITLVEMFWRNGSDNLALPVISCLVVWLLNLL